MSARDELRKQLDALMGANRNGEGSKNQKHFSDSSEFCKYYLTGFCPNELFSNTKLDIGECKKVHSDAMKRNYDEELEKGKDYGYDLDLERYLERILDDVDRKRERAKKRLEETDKIQTDEYTTQKISKLLKEAEQAGEEGKLKEAQDFLNKAEELKKKSANEITSIAVTNPVLASLGPDPMLQTRTQQQKLRVCDVCGLLLGVFEDDKRLADHYSGKLHIGVMKVREKLEELKKILATKKKQKLQKKLMDIITVIKIVIEEEIKNEIVIDLDQIVIEM